MSVWQWIVCKWQQQLKGHNHYPGELSTRAISKSYKQITEQFMDFTEDTGF